MNSLLRKRFVFVAVLWALVVVGAACTANKAALPIEEKELRFRVMHGFRTDPAVMEQAKQDASQNDSIATVGVALTDEEMQELQVRRQLLRVGAEVNEAGSKGHLTGFAGAYLDTSKGELMVGLTDMAEQQTVLHFVPPEHKERVTFFQAQFTEAELQVQMDVLTAHMSHLAKANVGIHDIGISVKDNKIEIGVLQDNEEVRTIITDLVDSEYVLFRENEPHLKLDSEIDA